LKRQTIETFPDIVSKIKTDGQLIKAMYADINSSDGAYNLGDQWKVEKHTHVIGRELSPDEPVTFDEMNNLWAGRAALVNASNEQITEYQQFLDTFCQSGEEYLSQLKSREKRSTSLLVADISIPFDYLMINHFFSGSNSNKNVILEVGGGYGILAEEFLTQHKSDLCYILVDAVPESIYYQYEFLKTRFPEKRIGSTLSGDTLAVEEFDAFVLPSWKLNSQKSLSIDIFINIASIQEMPEDVANNYLNFAKERLNENGLIYFQNSRDFHYRREYDFPSNWMYLFKSKTPRSRSYDYPLDILINKSKDQSRQNLPVLIRYYQSLKAELIQLSEKYESEKVSKLQQSLNNANNLLKRKQEQIEKLNIIAKSKQTLKDKVLEKNEIIHSLRDKQKASTEQIASLKKHQKTLSNNKTKLAEKLRNNLQSCQSQLRSVTSQLEKVTKSKNELLEKNNKKLQDKNTLLKETKQLLKEKTLELNKSNKIVRQYEKVMNDFLSKSEQLMKLIKNK
jgi:putative sugar O-methyltransferase